jgi:hypothetical protein
MLRDDYQDSDFVGPIGLCRMVANTQRRVFVAGIKIKSGIDVRMGKKMNCSTYNSHPAGQFS